ncbi:HAD-IA family hydrolase [Roseibium aestuarii]|uniref:HAD-IA family hydrolase n=1 Tax=Roseibium aestuarii TaxID=2600299 RepID=A0ABW4JXL6_9HYPH|nr:HAD-IA family hydrolase [Roseibium aestuarii]
MSDPLLIIFDCDGTLVDSQHTILHGLQVGFDAVGLTMPPRDVALSIVGLSLERAFEVLVGSEHASLAPRMADAYRTAKIDRRASGEDQDPLYPGALEVLHALHARDDVLLGIATGKARRGVDHMVATHGLEGLFVTIQTADTSPSKPHPDMILRALAETGLAPERTVMVGDTSFDMEMARNARTHALGVTWGYHDRARLMNGGAQAIIDHFTEFQQACDGLLVAEKEPA